MKIIHLLLVFILLIIFACNPKKSGSYTTTNNQDTVPYYPISKFLETQIQYVDLRNYDINKLFIKDGEKDSSRLSKEEFIAFAHKYYDTGAITNFKTQYKETVFHDLSTKSYTLHYSPIDTNAKIQSIDMLLDDETNMAKRLLIRTVFNKGDTSIIENLNWKAYKSFQVSRTLETNKGYHSTELLFIKWNEKP